MKQELGTRPWEQAIHNMKERLGTPLFWYPFPALISFALAVLLIGHLLPGLNPRLGSHADIITFPAEREREGAIWINLYPKDDNLVVTTSDRKSFTWPLALENSDPVQPFISYLKKRTEKEALATGLLMESNLTKTNVVLAVDQRLKFVHLRPVIYALAKAKITRYGFETMVVASQQLATREHSTN